MEPVSTTWLPNYKEGMSKEEYDAQLNIQLGEMRGYYTGNTYYIQSYLETFKALPPGSLHPWAVKELEIHPDFPKEKNEQ